MKKSRKLLVRSLRILGTLALGGIIFVGVHYSYVLDYGFREGITGRKFMKLGQSLSIYYEQFHAWPKKLEDLESIEKMDMTGLITDVFTQKPYLYFPEARYGTTDVLVAQPEPYRLGIWPFGKIRRFVLITDIMTYTILEGEDAYLSISDMPKAIVRQRQQ